MHLGDKAGRSDPAVPGYPLEVETVEHGGQVERIAGEIVTQRSAGQWGERDLQYHTVVARVA